MPGPTDPDRWKHTKVEKAIPLPNGDQLLLLEPGKAYGGDSNLVLVGKNGRTIWEAELVEKAPYTAVNFAGEKLIAFSWAGYMAEIDPQNGMIKSAALTK